MLVVTATVPRPGPRLPAPLAEHYFPLKVRGDLVTKGNGVPCIDIVTLLTYLTHSFKEQSVESFGNLPSTIINVFRNYDATSLPS